ncbi:MAG: hypothetical protein CMJ45_11380 [Planctomyces sp.]|nr:hypothetical protein [Planctomyces sp.]
MVPSPARVAHGTADENVPIEVVERLIASCADTGPGVRHSGMSHGLGRELGPETGGQVQIIGEFMAK